MLSDKIICACICVCLFVCCLSLSGKMISLSVHWNNLLWPAHKRFVSHGDWKAKWWAIFPRQCYQTTKTEMVWQHHPPPWPIPPNAHHNYLPVHLSASMPVCLSVFISIHLLFCVIFSNIAWWKYFQLSPAANFTAWSLIATNNNLEVFNFLTRSFFFKRLTILMFLLSSSYSW